MIQNLATLAVAFYAAIIAATLTYGAVTAIVSIRRTQRRAIAAGGRDWVPSTLGASWQVKGAVS